MGKNQRHKVMVTQRCEVCGYKMPIWRLRSRLKDCKHVKHMWCPECERVTAHTQTKCE